MSDTSLTNNLSCPCNNNLYENTKKLKSHQKTLGHRIWETQNDVKTLKCELTRRDNTIAQLERKLLDRDQRILVLKERSKVLKNCLQSRTDDMS